VAWTLTLLRRTRGNTGRNVRVAALAWNKARGEGKVPLPDSSPIIRGAVSPMTLTVAHITPIMSLIAGLLILIMPRLLNFIVAIFLILNGLIGLGLLKWLHL
jgi:hypothetical protein